MRVTEYRKLLIALLLALLLNFSIGAQNNFPGKSGDGRELAISASMDNISFDNIGIGAGFVIEDFLFIGLDLGVGFEELQSVPSQELQLGVTCRAAVLQQDELFPISCTISGSFKKNNFKSDYLADNDLIKSGTGYSVGLDIFRDFTLTPKLALRVGLTGSYMSSSYTTEPETGLVDYEDRIFENNIDYLYGIIVGLSVEITERMIFSVDLKGCLNSDFHVIYGPSIRISSFSGPEEE